MEKITVLIPCHNEEKGIGRVIDTVPVIFLQKLGLTTEIIVINNNSTDKTVQIAEKRNVRIIHETKKGKGNAILTGFKNVSSDTAYVVMLDGDNTYKSHEIPRLVEPLMSNFCDVIIGSRLSGKMKKNSLRFRNRVANWTYTFIVRHFYRANTTDVLSGFFAWKKEVIDKLIPHLHSEGFEIEMEMITKMTRLGFEMYSVPITYDLREGETKFEMYSVPITYDLREGETKIEAIRDGVRILAVFVRNFTWTPRPKEPFKTTAQFIERVISVFL